MSTQDRRTGAPRRLDVTSLQPSDRATRTPRCPQFWARFTVPSGDNDRKTYDVQFADVLSSFRCRDKTQWKLACTCPDFWY